MKILQTYYLYFLIYSFLGWLCESIYISIHQKKWINSGFLKSPICPIYGIGSICVILLLSNYKNNPYLIFIASILITTIIEYYGAFLLEKIFHKKYWDYSNYKFNIQGRICLLNSILFGILSLLIIYIIHPAIKNIFDTQQLKPILFIITIILFIDISISSLQTIYSKKIPLS